VPFPDAVEADGPAQAAAASRELGGSTRPASKIVPPPPAPAVPRAPRQPIGPQLRKTLTNVRALPLWRRRIPPAVFAAVAGVLIAILVGVVATMRASTPEVPKENTAEYKRRARERTLRGEATQFLRQGRINEAYAKYEELRRSSPRSPYVLSQMQKLNAIRREEAVGREQMAQSQQKLTDAMALYTQKKYAEAIPIFQEALTLNPTSPDAAEYLKLAQAEDAKAQAAKLAARQQRATTASRRDTTTTAATATTASIAPTETAAAANEVPAQLTTSFNHPFTDGTLLVKFGAETVVSTPLWEEVGRAMFRRHKAKPIHVTSEIAPKNADLQIWVLVPKAPTQYHLIPAAKFAPGSSHRLNISYNQQTKTLAYELN
jgi:outer membrane protein assembly factor BamD (BamD/ComL family)